MPAKVSEPASGAYTVRGGEAISTLMGWPCTRRTEGDDGCARATKEMSCPRPRLEDRWLRGVREDELVIRCCDDSSVELVEYREEDDEEEKEEEEEYDEDVDDRDRPRAEYRCRSLPSGPWWLRWRWLRRWW